MFFIFYLRQDLGLVGSFTSGILAGGGCSVRERQGVNGSWNFQGGNLEFQAKAWQQEQRGKKNPGVLGCTSLDRALESGLSLPA